MGFGREVALIFAAIFVFSLAFAAPAISSITTSVSSGNYKAGAIVPITVTFDSDINVTGSPSLSLNSGGSATYLDATNNSLDFNYVVASGQNSTGLAVTQLGPAGSIVSAADGNNADLTISTNLSPGIVIDTNGPSCSVASPVNNTDYNAATISGLSLSFTCIDTGVGLDSSTAKLDGNIVSNGASLAGVPSGAHAITIDANDSLGNSMGTMTINFNYDTNAPIPVSISASRYTNDTTPEITLNVTHNGTAMTSGNIQITCNKSSSWKTVAFSNSKINSGGAGNDFSITSSTYGCSTSANSDRTIFVKFGDAAGNWSSDINAVIGYDNTLPSTPGNLGASAGDGTVHLSWDTPSSDNFSGNSQIRIYKDGTSLTDINISNTSYDAESLSNGTQYCFKISTLDTAGNESNLTSQACATPSSTSSSITVKKSGSLAYYAKDGDALAVECDYSSSISGAKIETMYYTPDTSSSDLQTAAGSVTSLSGTFTVNSSYHNYQKVGFWCEASGISDSFVYLVSIDNAPPAIYWTDSNSTATGARTIFASANDSVSLGKVEFDFNKVTYSGKKSDSNSALFSIDLNTLRFDNGDYNITARAIDSAGNKKEITRKITIANISSAKQKAALLIQSAKTAQKTANDLVSYFAKEALALPAELAAKKGQADADLASAQNIADTNSDGAVVQATNANALYEEFNGKAKVDTNQTKSYSFDANSLPDALKALGLSEEQAKRAADAINGSGIERKIKLVEISGDSSKLQVKVEISLTNDTNETELKIIEVIPKEFASSADGIISGSNFAVLQKDPVIMFDINLAKGAKTTISYGLGEITAERADKIMDTNVITKFSSPPLIMWAGDNPAALFNNGLFDSQTTLLIIAIVIALAVICAAIFFIKFARPGHGFGEKKSIAEHLSPEKETRKDKPKFGAP